MAVDVTAVARVVGITTQFKNLRSGIAAFPQRVVVLAQGDSDVTYSADKFQAATAGEAGARFGFRSPIYNIVRQLFPVNGDGIGTVPVTVYPLSDDGSGVAATGDITPSGTASAQASYQVRISGILGNSFVLPAGAVDVTDACRKIGQSILAVHYMPVKVTYEYGTVTATPDGANAGDGTVTTLSADTALPGDWILECTSVPAAEQAVFSLTDPEGTVVSSSITLDDGAGGTEVVDVGGVQFTITDGAADFESGDSFTIAVPATAVNVTASWKGASSNALTIEIVGPSLGISFAITQPTGGLVNPDVDPALALMGDIWETMIINQMNIDDTATLDKIQTFGDGRWGETVKKPLVAFTGNTATTVAAATAVSSGRRTDRVNSQLVAPGSPNLPFVVAARQVARIARSANNKPASGYAAQRVTGILPGTDGEQWTFPQRDQALKAGSSTVELKDGVLNVSQVITFYRPVGEEPPAYQFVRNIVKLQNIIFNTNLIFEAPEWAAAPLIPDEQATANPDARKPKQAKGEINAMIGSLALNAIISDPETAKAQTTAVINSTNPNRLDTSVTVQLSGNSDIISHTENFGFFFGDQAAA